MQVSPLLWMTGNTTVPFPSINLHELSRKATVLSYQLLRLAHPSHCAMKTAYLVLMACPVFAMSVKCTVSVCYTLEMSEF